MRYVEFISEYIVYTAVSVLRSKKQFRWIKLGSVFYRRLVYKIHVVMPILYKLSVLNVCV
jgi:hypothetical protein